MNNYRSSFFFFFSFKKKSTVNANFLSRVNLEVCLQKGTQLSCSQASCLAVLSGSRQSHTVCTYSVGEEEEDPRGTTSQAIYTSSGFEVILEMRSHLGLLCQRNKRARHTQGTICWKREPGQGGSCQDTDHSVTADAE